jgi:uncharacterized membrane protein YhfC
LEDSQIKALKQEAYIFKTMVKATESSIWLCGIFGGLMAGLLEEAGCFTVFKTVLKRNYIKAAVVLANFGVTR